MKNTQRKLIVIIGPTASGKTGLGVKLAKEFNGEIVSADSRQVFRRLDIGTAKEGVPNKEWIANKTDSEKIDITRSLDYARDDILEYLKTCLRWIDGIPQWIIDIKDPGEKFTLFDYLPLARVAIENIFKRGKVPIIVGGTGLYIQGLIEGFVLEKYQISNIKYQKYNREQLNNLSAEQLQKVLKEINPEEFEDLADQKNPHRLIRAIERAQEGLLIKKKRPDFEALQIGLDWPRQELCERIDKRVDERFEQGMLGEIISLLRSGVNSDWLMSLGLEYGIVTEFLISNCSNQITNPKSQITDKSQIKNIKNSKEFIEMKETLKLKSHQYAKRQLTWFKRFPEIVWESDDKKIIKLVKNYLN